MEDELLEEQQELQEENKSNQTNKKVLKTAVKAGVNYFTAGQGGKVVEIASKIKVVDNVLNAGGKMITDASKSLPGGDLLQNTLNKANDSGAIDLANTAMGTPDTEKNIDTEVISSTTSNDKVEESLIKKSAKATSSGLLLVLLVPLFLIIFVAVLIMPDSILNLTDGDSSNKLALGNTGGITLTDEQIENKLIYIGDSRITNLKDQISNVNIKYITEDSGYYWFVESGKNQLSSYISADIEKFVVISFGKNDITNIGQYINAYNILINNYNNVKFYFMSVNPVDEELASLNGYTITNTEIEAFNSKLSASFKNSYIDVYGEIKDKFETEDGIHYSNDTNNLIHNKVVSYIKEQNNLSFLGSYGDGNGAVELKGKSLLDTIGSDGITTLNNYVNQMIDVGGRCTGGGVAGAATGLIDGLLQKGIKIPYYYGGGHGSFNGINASWGSKIGASIPTPKGTVYYHNGLDCSGFVSWAMNAAGVSGGTTATGYLNYGPQINYEEATPGDLLVLDKPGSLHVILVIENKGTYLQVAESTTGGVRFSTMNKSKVISSGYKVVDIDNYYRNNCKDSV